jgi:TonB family protein
LFLLLALSTPLARTVVQGQDRDDKSSTAHAIELFRQGNTDEAIKILNEVVKHHPDDADAWYYLGLAYQGQGLIGAARPAFEHLLSLRPDSADANAKLAYALILANEPQSAIARAKHAIEFGDQSPESHYAIAEGELRSGAFQLAIQEAEVTLRIKSDFAAALITKSLAHHALKEYEEAAASVEKFLALSPDDEDAAVWRGNLEEWRNRTYQPSNSDPKSVFTSKEATKRVVVRYKPEPQYTESARKAGVMGTVRVQAIFSSDGEVKHIFVVKALGYGLSSQAAKAARQIKFDPATMDGKPVSMYMTLEYNFNLY